MIGKSKLYIEYFFKRILGGWSIIDSEPKYIVFRIFVCLSVCLFVCMFGLTELEKYCIDLNQILHEYYPGAGSTYRIYIITLSPTGDEQWTIISVNVSATAGAIMTHIWMLNFVSLSAYLSIFT